MIDHVGSSLHAVLDRAYARMHLHCTRCALTSTSRTHILCNACEHCGCELTRRCSDDHAADAQSAALPD